MKMLKRQNIASLLLLYFCTFVNFFNFTNALWPIPQQWSNGSSTLVLYPSVEIKLTIISPTSEDLSIKTKKIFNSAKNRFQQYLIQEKYVSPNVKFNIPTHPSKKILQLIEIEVYDGNSELELGVNESYCLLLDTSRNYYSIDDILKTIEIMSWNKMNVFHWHIVDATSWPVVSKKFPKLSEKGAYDPKTMIYTKQDIRIVDEYAKLRGIRVVPEFDMPGHTHSISGGYPELISCINEQPRWDLYAAEPPSGQLNPARKETYEFIKTLIPEMASYFSDKYYHAGGDEIKTKCWEEDEYVKKYLSSNSGSSTETLLAKIIDEIQNTVISAHKIPMFWQETVATHDLNITKDAIIQVWYGNDTVKNVVNKGYKTIVGSAEYWYLDCGHGGWVGNNINGNSWCDPYKTWQKIYSFNPINGLTDDEAKLVIGGEALLWSEQADPNNFEQLLWPRSSAVAEVLWSGPQGLNVNEALPRLHDLRFRLVGRGVKAEPLQPLWCVLHGGCDMPNS
ncbi:4891_t:CDS:2 [Diversispora eburnea]|uniref:Beta-hexosaminidase n=1 Tax=Diversispora eburnea TaxID=1213867 RepID=A0A9N9G281_9GLOM|nr:4891_t:CDS:2 [Diversispora eburnea]